MVARLIRSLELWVLVFALSILVPLAWARWLEPRLFPVITRLDITAIRAEAGGSVVAGRAERLRACDWVETGGTLGGAASDGFQLRCTIATHRRSDQKAVRPGLASCLSTFLRHMYFVIPTPMQSIAVIQAHGAQSRR